MLNQLDKDQTAFLIDNLFYILEVNNVSKQNGDATFLKIVGLGNRLLSLIGIAEYSELYNDAYNIMHKVYLSWIETKD